MLIAGTTLGPYSILAPLGAGGMGEVYRARDARLERDVAVKVIPTELAREPDRIRRFEQEARAAGALNHPNVCTILDVGTHDGAPFVVMELLEGETLRERLAHGPIPPRKAADLIAQVAHGLAAAHEKGIVHRDLKPENVFVTRDGRVKVLDFGLAKLTRTETVAPAAAAGSDAPTLSGAILGTIGYMAPEQVRGEPADARSDLFALGTILHEMITGRRAFQGANFVETLHAILHTEAGPLSGSGREVPAVLESIVRRCLEKNPEERFQSARDLAFSLEAGGRVAHAAMLPPLARRQAAPWWALAISIAALAVAATALLVWRRGPSAPDDGPASRRVVVAVFENLTGDASLAPLGRMSSDWITQGLSRVEGLEVVPSTSVLYAQPAGGRRVAGGDPVRALARATDASVVVSGAYYLQGDTLRFQARITDVARGRLMQSLDPVSGARGAPLEAVDALRQRVMGALAAGTSTVHGIGVQQLPPRYDAYAEFIAGFELVMTDDAGALAHFERAMALDPGFLTPLFYEAYLLDRGGDHARVAGILSTLDRQRDQLPPFGRQWLDIMLAYAGHRYEEALQHVREAHRIAPRDPMVTLWIGYMAMLSDRPHEVVAAYDRFGPRPYPDHVLGTAWMQHLCGALHLLGDHKREFREAHRARVEHPDQSDLWTFEADALAALGRGDEVRVLADERLSSTLTRETPVAMMLDASAELRAHGDRQQALAVADRAMRWCRDRLERAPGDAPTRRGLLDALVAAERWEEAYALCADLGTGEPGDPDLRGQLGALAFRTGRRDVTARVAEELRKMGGPYAFGVPTYRRACMAALAGEKQSAVELVRASLAEGLRFGLRLHRDADLESIWAEPAFRALAKPRD